LIQAIKERSSG